MPDTIKIKCPAKINLTLKITGKRDDGFHNIDSIMQTINLFDYLTISTEKSDETDIILSGTSDEIPYNEKNLVYKAAKLFLENITSPLEGEVCFQNEPKMANFRKQGEGYKISIYIEKNIPIAAGLAGGSTDAAGTLYGLNKLFKEPLTKKQLHQLCSQLGSDLNLCLEGGRQKTSGRGEILEPLPFEEFDISLIKPIHLGISAKEAYTKFSEKLKNYSDITLPTLTLPLKEGGNNKFSHKYTKYAQNFSKELRKNMTDAERKLWQHIRKEQINKYKFRRQQPIGQYIVDFVCQTKKLIIEIDGGQHNDTTNIAEDKKRTEFLKQQGYTVIRFWNNEINENINGVLEKIISTLNSLPTRGGGLGWGETCSREEFENDLEWAVIDDYEELQHIKSRYPNSIMSGSGSTYFGIGFDFEQENDFWVKNGLKAISYGVKEV